MHRGASCASVGLLRLKLSTGTREVIHREVLELSTETEDPAFFIPPGQRLAVPKLSTGISTGSSLCQMLSTCRRWGCPQVVHKTGERWGWSWAVRTITTG